jgi:predicted nucleotidyltransferase component of viral defense system
MREKVIKNLEASIRAKLLNHAKAASENYNAVLNRFFQERFLARLSETKFKKHFILKGGLLLLTEHVTKFRPTVDIDLLGVNIDTSSKTIESVIKEICEISLQDGIVFNSNDLSSYTLKEDTEYEGLRFKLSVYLGKLRSIPTKTFLSRKHSGRHSIIGFLKLFVIWDLVLEI